MARPTGRGEPMAGFRCISRPGPALTSTMAPRCSSSGREMSSATRSTPAMSRPTTRAARVTVAATLGCTRSVTSKATLPLRWISTTRPDAGTDVAVEALALQFELKLGVGLEHR